MKNNVTLNDLNFYYSFLKEKVDNFLNDKDLNEEQYNKIFNQLIKGSLKAEINDKDFKKKIDSLKETQN